jgi:hypothetical protein
MNNFNKEPKMSFPQNYTCPEVRIPFNIPHEGAYAFTTLSVAADSEKRHIEFKKILSYTSCPQESVIFHEQVKITPKDALKQCRKDKECRNFVDFYIFRKGFTVPDVS